MEMSSINTQYSSQSSMSLSSADVELIDEIVTADMSQGQLLEAVGVSVLKNALEISSTSLRTLQGGLDTFI